MALIPYDLKIEFSPIRMNKKDDKPIELLIDVRNMDKEENLTSVVVEIPNEIGFDKVGAVNKKEFRIGTLKKDEEKKFVVKLYSNHRSEKGSYNISVIANKHYRGYSHIINNTQKNIVLRIV